ncbi:TIGR03885 family FMN-dependent LLM class oxidoreductase [Muricoccus radiodurans]|uniref:TIGR03885 family FMN-dependent LLM class oxidoreductase n=1 Tax=Muricoccus radiodurans TaxID=2231721 RepID=UPI003CEA18DA
MTRFSYHVSHEQFPPRDLLDLVQQAEAAGFDAAFSSDHLQPWAAVQGQSGFAWSWLGAAMQATRKLSFGIISVPGGWRYSPAVLAQAIATLGQLFPGRLPWVALGSGQAMNEAVTGQPWPDKAERNARLREGADIIRALLAGETVTHRGRVTVVEARIWSRPKLPSRLIGAAISEETAEWVGGWADGLLTAGSRPEALRRTVAAFRRGGGEGKPIYLKADLCWAPTEEEALRQAHEQWRFNLLGGEVNWDLRTPAHFEAAARFIRPDDLRGPVHVSADPARHVDWLAECAGIGFESIDLHHVGTDQRRFIEIFGDKVLPALRA